MADVICPHCNQPAECVGGKRIYPHRRDLYSKWFWLCGPCNAYCGCHPKSKRPLGSLANPETRAARSRAHSKFDPIWKGGRLSRNAAYRWLSESTGIPFKQCHIGMMTVEQCELVVKAIRERRKFPAHRGAQ